ncbi:O-glucosyltransferase rumi homolog [Artemia franciscana]|uniref:O-glucosyltransferase rumi homolog n=1 Tax=Artemia franciscana TaxID=6661 RepID=UPI0032DAB5D1
MKILTTLCCIFTLHKIGVKCSEGTCSADQSDCSDLEEDKKYAESKNNRWSHYLEEIEKAKASYEPCQSSNCSCHTTLIEKDLLVFKDGITEDLINRARTKGVLYQILNGKVYREEECMFPFRCSGIEHFLHKISAELPDTEFVVNTRDWPQVPNYRRDVLPVFSFSKTNDFYDITYPAWTFWEGGPAISLYPRGLGRWDQHRISVRKAAKKWPWKKKKDVAFFRGSRTSGERDPLVLLSRKRPDLVDAQYTKNQAWRSEKDTLGAPPAAEVSLEDHCQYKYLFNYRGVAASFRFKHLFLCESLVFHVGNEWIEFFYPAMKPWIHYIPVSKDADEKELSDLIEFAKYNDDLVKAITANGAEFIQDHLKFEDITCYWRELLKKYSKLLKYRVKKDDKVKVLKG